MHAEIGISGRFRAVTHTCCACRQQFTLAMQVQNLLKVQFRRNSHLSHSGHHFAVFIFTKPGGPRCDCVVRCHAQDFHRSMRSSYWQQRVPSTSSTSLRSSVQPTRFSHEVTIAQILCCLPSVRIIVLRDDSSVSGHCSVCGCASDHRDFELLGLSPPPLNQYHAPV